MTVYKNLEKLNFQVVEIEPKGDDKALYRYYFKNKETGEIGVPLPDFESKIKENYSEKYLETLISQVFDEHAPIHTIVENFYIQAILTKKEQKTLSKGLQDEYAKKVSDIIKNTNEQTVTIFEKDDNLFAVFQDPQFNKLKAGQNFEDNVRYDEYTFLSSIHSFKPYNSEIFFCEDTTITVDDAYEGFSLLGFKTFIKNV